MKKIIALLLTGILSVSILASCSVSAGTPNSSGGEADNGSNFKASSPISVVSREDGSGTRGAFIELFGIEENGEDGTKTDKTTDEATIANKTDVMITNVSGDDYAIGYLSLGSINDSIKVFDVDSVKASAENVKNGTYKIARPFNIATKGEASGLTKDFIDYIMSKEGQEVISKSYISITDDAAPYTGTKPEGKITISGSSSVTPIMEKLVEAYNVINPKATIEINMTDSSAGVKSVVDGTSDIGMASRDLKDSEKEEVTGLEIALDGIAVIANNNNSLTNITSEQVKQIFTGEATKWDEVIK